MFSSILEFQAKAQLELKILQFRIKNLRKQNFKCPICGYHGPFFDMSLSIGVDVEHERCIRCRSWTRHRLQQLVIDEIFKNYDPTHKRILHFAPEHFFQKQFKNKFKDYTSADIAMEGVDVQCDMIDLPFKDAEFDFVCACHVLEHIRDDIKAISEIRRVLKPNGIAILAVPIIGKQTIEYPEANPHEWDHVRAPGEDYFERYAQFFSEVKQYRSTDFPDIYQLFINEDRSLFPNDRCPLRPTIQGNKHIDYIPVCYV
ncbi:MAG: class I SAM-dependent methyltransferase [Cyanobacteria bacterium SBLK]|nr:class I SAM-dependent methyltransferase [Cyanobacteria bacterium SBLK]